MRLSQEKLIFSHGYWDSFKKFEECLSTKGKFYNSLTNRPICDKSYEYVLNVWKTFRMKSMKAFNYLYLKLDVLLLACVFETFKDPDHYLCTPSYTWDAMKKFAAVTIKLISDIAGGISMTSKGYVEVTIDTSNCRVLRSLHHISNI